MYYLNYLPNACDTDLFAALALVDDANDRHILVRTVEVIEIERRARRVKVFLATVDAGDAAAVDAERRAAAAGRCNHACFCRSYYLYSHTITHAKQ